MPNTRSHFTKSLAISASRKSIVKLSPMHRVPFDAFFLRPSHDLRIGNHAGVCAARDGLHILHMIAVPMRDQDVVGGYVLDVDVLCDRVTGDKRVEE